MTLPEVLHAAIHLLDATGDVSCPGRDRVVIARGQQTEPLDGRSQAIQIRLRHDRDMGLSEYRCETRGWLGEQWQNWYERRGWLGGAAFDIADVLATDWRILS